MKVYRVVLGTVITLIWAAMFVTAAFIDPTLTPLAKEATKPLLGVVGFVFAIDGYQMVKKRADEA